MWVAHPGLAALHGSGETTRTIRAGSRPAGFTTAHSASRHPCALPWVRTTPRALGWSESAGGRCRRRLRKGERNSAISITGDSRRLCSVIYIYSQYNVPHIISTKTVLIGRVGVTFKEPGFDDSGWEAGVSTPHDFVAAGVYSFDADPKHGYLLRNRSGWYRKRFNLPAGWDQHGATWLHFEGTSHWRPIFTWTASTMC